MIIMGYGDGIWMDTIYVGDNNSLNSVEYMQKDVDTGGERRIELFN
jgi:hypothetical protein